MKKRFCVLFLAIAFMVPSRALCQEKVRVLIAPFEINASQERMKLRDEIPDVLGKQLEEAGAHIARLPEGASFPERIEGAEDAKRLGTLTAADQVIQGSLTWIGQKFSLDVKMYQTFADKPPEIFFREGQGAADLSSKLREISEDIGVKLFKRERVKEVVVEGNDRIEADAIKRRISTAPGDVFLAKSLSEDLKNVFNMGYFEDVRVESEDTADGKIIVFKVKEKPTVRMIKIKGNTVYDEEEIKENLDIRTGSILNIFRINSNVERIETIYKEKNYHNVKVDYEIEELENNQADLRFVIDEGDKVRIKNIFIEGNETYDDDELKDLMKTSEKGFFSWLTSSGDLKREDLNQDVGRIQAYYQNHGFIQARVGDPKIEFKEDYIDVTIKIDEGPQFKVGKIGIKGDLVLPEEDLMAQIQIAKETFYNREVVRNDVLALTDLYSDEGYAYADIAPTIDQKEQDLTVDIVYAIAKGPLVHFEKIMITGNTKTRDKVIRREMKVYEQEQYSGRLLKRGVKNLYRLDYFEDVKVDTRKGSTEDSMVLRVDVKEKPTGAFSFGGGYSSVEDVFVMGSVSQKNLFGRGQVLELKGTLGGTSSRYTLSFTEPWLFDIPLSFGVDLYKWDRDYDTYDKEATGGGLRFSYPVFDYTRVYLGYKYEVADITEITDDASDSIKELAGENTESAVSTSIRYDSRDRVFNPTEGQNHALTFEYAGLGGDIGYTKLKGEAGVYIPLFWSTRGLIHMEGGWVEEAAGKLLPDYEKFYLGGIDSMRGFDYRDIHATDEDGKEVGGTKYVQMNLEFIFPLVEKAGLVGVIFYDTGNVYGEGESVNLGELRESAGGGFRWYSPMGPIRIEYGYILDYQDEEDRGQWEFSMGATF